MRTVPAVEGRDAKTTSSTPSAVPDGTAQRVGAFETTGSLFWNMSSLLAVRSPTRRQRAPEGEESLLG